jgi:hypothetical protein
MGCRESYRLDESLLSIHSEESGRRIPILLPPGAVVTITAGPLDGLRLVEVILGKEDSDDVQCGFARALL